MNNNLLPTWTFSSLWVMRFGEVMAHLGGKILQEEVSLEVGLWDLNALSYFCFLDIHLSLSASSVLMKKNVVSQLLASVSMPYIPIHDGLCPYEKKNENSYFLCSLPLVMIFYHIKRKMTNTSINILPSCNSKHAMLWTHTKKIFILWRWVGHSVAIPKYIWVF